MPLPLIAQTEALLDVGLRIGTRTTHTSRTTMQTEVFEVIEAVPDGSSIDAYQKAIEVENVLGKRSMANRLITSQRLRELYALDHSVMIFRTMRYLWDFDLESRPMLAHLCALARDTLLRVTAEYVIPLSLGTECIRTEMLKCLSLHLESRLNDSILNKVAANAGSSWTRSGHLIGRNRKIRSSVKPRPASVAFALWLGHLEGRVADELLDSFWMKMFDASKTEILDEVIRAKQLNLVRATIGAGIVEIDATHLTKQVLSK
jgi:hypothetical protein